MDLARKFHNEAAGPMIVGYRFGEMGRAHGFHPNSGTPALLLWPCRAPSSGDLGAFALHSVCGRAFGEGDRFWEPQERKVRQSRKETPLPKGRWASWEGQRKCKYYADGLYADHDGQDHEQVEDKSDPLDRKADGLSKVGIKDHESKLLQK